MSREEEIQKKIQDNAIQEIDKDDPDVIAYLRVFRALPKTREYSVPERFAETVIRKLERKQKRIFLLHEYMWLTAGILLLVTAGAYTVTRLDFKIDFGFLNAFSYKGVLVFGIFFIAMLNYIDRRVIRKTKKLI